MHGLQAAMPTQGSIWNMNRKRPRPHWSGHLLLVLWITPMQAFVKPPVFRSLGFTTPRYCGRGARSQASPAVVLHDDNSGGDEKSDPLPRTMEELYRRMRMSPPVDLSAEYEQKPDHEDMVIIEKAIRYVCKPMEEESWWEENGEEWDRVMSNPKSIFGSITLDDEDNEDIGYDMLTEVLSTSPSYKLSSYKAGGHSNADLSLTPFAQYWDSLPDLRVSNRVYTYNVVDRMAALKSIMNCTFNGMHGSADCHQVSRLPCRRIRLSLHRGWEQERRTCTLPVANYSVFGIGTSLGCCHRNFSRKHAGLVFCASYTSCPCDGLTCNKDSRIHA